MSYASFVSMKPGWEKVTSSTKVRRLAEEGYMFPGRWFKYALSGAALVVGNLHTSVSATGAHDLDLVPTANRAIGDTTVTIASLTITEDEYADGFLIFNDEEQEGTQYLIKGNTGAAAANSTITLDEEEGLVVAITTAQQMGLVHSVCFDVVVYPNTPTGAPIGVACSAWADNDYGWLQFRGPACANLEVGTAITAGDALMPSVSTAGAMELLDQSNDTDDFGIIAWMGHAVGSNAEAAAVLMVG